MPHYIAFLRGINVGGHRVKMDRLRELFTGLGLKDVSTFIASGNVVFSTDAEDTDVLRETIEGNLLKELSYEVATFLRTPAELAAITAFDPAATAAETLASSSHYVILLDTPASESMRSDLGRMSSEMDHFYFSGAEVHWLIDGRLSESPLFGSGLDGAMRGVRTTTRNMNTLRRIAAKVGLGDEP